MHPVFSTSIGVGVFLLLVLFGLSRHPQYETESLIYIQPLTARMVTDTTGGSYDANRYESYVQQQLQTIVRPDILGVALSRLPEGTWRGPKESEQSAVARLAGALSIKHPLGTYQVSVGMSGSDPARITRIVNAVVDAYLSDGRKDELAQSDQQLEVLKVERDRLQGDLNNARLEQARLSSELGVADTTGENGNPFDVQLEELRKQLASARAAHAVAEAQLASVSSTTSGSGALNAAADELVSNDPGLSSLKSATNQRRTILTSQMAGLTTSNPLYRQDEEELKRLNDSIEALSTDLRKKAAIQVERKYQLEAARTSEVMARLATQLARQTSIATSATPELQRASDLAMTIKRLQTSYTEVDAAVQSIVLEHSSSGTIHRSMAAIQPLQPKAGKKNLILGLALPAALLCALLAAEIRRRLDHSIYVAEDVFNLLDISPMAVLPTSKEVQDSVVNEFMLRLVAGVDQAHRVGEARTYLFTGVSAASTTGDLLASLAAKMERLGYRTMTLTATDALEHITTGSDSAATGSTQAHFSKATDSHLAPTKRMNVVAGNIERLKQNVDFLFIEGFPLLYSAESEFVARLVDATFLIVQSGQTSRDELKNSLVLVRRLKVPGVAVVLTDLHQRNADRDFVKLVQTVVKRQTEVQYDTGSTRSSLRKKASLSIYPSMDVVEEEQKTAAAR